MLNFIRDLFDRIKKGMDGSNIPSAPPSTDVTSCATAPAELKNEANAARELLKKEAQMKMARLLRKL